MASTKKKPVKKTSHSSKPLTFALILLAILVVSVGVLYFYFYGGEDPNRDAGDSSSDMREIIEKTFPTSGLEEGIVYSYNVNLSSGSSGSLRKITAKFIVKDGEVQLVDYK